MSRTWSQLGRRTIAAAVEAPATISNTISATISDIVVKGFAERFSDALRIMNPLNEA